MKIFEAINTFAKTKLLLSPDSKVVIGFSAGPDSVFLMHWAKQYLVNPTEQIVLLYCNHQLRPKEIPNELDILKSYAKQYALISKVVTLDLAAYIKQMRCSTETAGRDLRRKSYQDAVISFGAEAILLGHHLDDVCESFMMQLLRGAKSGLVGIRPTTRLGSTHVMRPLLKLTKKEIMQSVVQNQWLYSEDSTNTDLDFTRNKMRQILKESFVTIAPEYAKKIEKTCLYLQGIEETMDQLTDALLAKCSVPKDGLAAIERQYLLDTAPVIRAHFLNRFLKKYLHPKEKDKQICDVQIELTQLLIERGYGKCSLPDNHFIELNKKSLTLKAALCIPH